MPGHIRLSLIHDPALTATGPAPPAGWPARTFVLTPARSGGAQRHQLELAPETVLELVLENGIRLLVAAGDAERYLGNAVRGGNGAGVIQVGQALRPTGPHLPQDAAREGAGTWILKALRVYSQGPAGMTALAAAGSFQDSRLEHREGLYRCDTGRWELSPVDTIPAGTRPVLLFLHGTASSTEGSFQGLWQEAYRPRIAERYGDRVYGLEHRSLTESPVANALDLVRKLPGGAVLHLVTHSRGGLVGELLARAQRVGAEPFTEEDIHRLLEHAKRTGRAGYAAIAEQLRQLNRELMERAPRIERFVRVACPARGTTLASGRLDRWASVMLNLFGWGLGAMGTAVPLAGPAARTWDLLQGFLLAVVRERADARILPGLEAMMPDSPLVALLNAPEVRLAGSLHVLAGDYRGDGLLAWLSDCLSEAFYGGRTDLVVNTPSMTGGAERELGIYRQSLAGPEVHHLSYFRRDESALALVRALAGDHRGFERLAAPSRASISRGGRRTQPKPDAPIVLLLPGIMGSHLRSDGDRIWFDPCSLVAGGMERLVITAGGVRTDGWQDLYYEGLARYLAESHEVRPCVYDWRRSIREAAQHFGRVLDRALGDARGRGKPVRIVAHSMGGLVARLALKDRWEAFKSLPGSRLLQLGTPNGGSHAMAVGLLGRDEFIQMIGRWFDWKHDLRAFLGIVRDYPGVLELLPWPGADGRADDGHDYFAIETWQRWHAQDGEAQSGGGWEIPPREALSLARKTVEELRQAPLDPACTRYVAGCGETPVAIRCAAGKIEVGYTSEGDGRVAWRTGIPAGVPVWYTDAAHGDLPRQESAFSAYLELLESGHTHALPETPPSVRGAAVPVYRPRTLAVHTLYPTAEEVLAAAVGGSRTPPERDKQTAPAVIEVIHGSLAGAESPVLIGAYANDSLRGSADFLDRRLGGCMAKAHRLGRYPNQPGEVAVFLNPVAGDRPGGSIVVGLGPIGELRPGTLTRALTHGLLEYVRVREQRCGRDREPAAAVSALLVGTGYGGLDVPTGVRCLIEAVRTANLQLEQAGMTLRVGGVTLFEEAEDRATIAVESLDRLVRERRFAATVAFDGRLTRGAGGYRRYRVDSSGSAWPRVHITTDPAGGLRFTLVSDRARNQVSEEPNQRQAVDGLIRSATATTSDQTGLSRALFELMVPNEFKDPVAELRGLILAVDAAAAAYPWELMRDGASPLEPPLAARIGMVRQLASPHGRRRVQTVESLRLLAVGDTRSGLAELAGAQEEARGVADRFGDAGYRVNLLVRPDAQQVLVHLFDGHYRCIHLAGHGVVAQDGHGHTGLVLGPDVYLTTAQISKLKRVPEFVFLNGCHLGSMAPDARPRWGRLAANLATEFIEMGCKAVIAAGWAVDDRAAATFAHSFYTTMLAGGQFGEAVRRARAETFARHPASNTWGAFQAYGDERYRLLDRREEAWQPPRYVHTGQLIADLDLLRARFPGATAQEHAQYEHRLAALEEAGARWSQVAAVRENLGAAWAGLGNRKRAIGHYRAALAQEDGSVSLHAMEQLAGLEIDLGADQAKDGDQSGLELMAQGQAHLNQLIAIAPTARRLSLLGSCWKRRLEVIAPGGGRRQIEPALEAMAQAYWQAAEESLFRTGERDCDPLLNALDGIFLLKARGREERFDQLQPQLAGLLSQAVANSRHRNRGFCHALMEVEAQRVDALWACLDGRGSAALVQPEIRDRLAGDYRSLLARPACAQARDPILSQLGFIRNLLPRGKHHEGLRRALASLTDACAPDG